MRISILQILFLLVLGLFFFADLSQLAKKAKQKIKSYKKLK